MPLEADLFTSTAAPLPARPQPGRPSVERSLTVDGAVPANGPKQWNTWYDRIIDVMIQSPELRLKDVAQKLDCTQGWLSQIIRTDMFKERLSQRVGEHQELVSRSTIELAENVAHMALRAMEERLEADAANPVPFGELRETADVMLSKLGYGNKHAQAAGVPGGASPQLHLHVSANTLSEARKAMQDVQARTIDNPGLGHDAVPALPSTESE